MDYQDKMFERYAIEVPRQIEMALSDYIHAAAWSHGRCRSRTFDRIDFRKLYETLTMGAASSAPLQAQGRTLAVASIFKPWSTFPTCLMQNERHLNERLVEYYQTYYPDTVDYRGFVGLNEANSTATEPHDPAPFFFLFVVGTLFDALSFSRSHFHTVGGTEYVEPVQSNEEAIGLDLYASESRRKALSTA